MSFVSQVLGGSTLLWVSGLSYYQGQTVISPITSLEYVRKSTGAGATDPSADVTNWKRNFGIAATKELSYGFNSAGFNELSGISSSGRSHAIIYYVSPSSLAIDTFSTMFSFSGAISISHLNIIRNGNHTMTWGAKITIDGEVVFDRSSSSGSTSGYGMVFAGREAEAAGFVTLPPIVALESVLIEWKHSIAAVGSSLLAGSIIYQELK